MYIGIIYKTNWCHVGSCFTNVIYNVEDIFSSPVLYIYSIVVFFFLQISYFTRIHSPHHLALQALLDIFSTP